MKTMTLPAVLESIPPITEFVDAELDRLDCPMKAQMQLDIVIDELFSNIARYAYPDGPGEATVSIDFAPETRTVSLVFADSGIPYNPLEKEDPDVTLPLEQRSIGGLGIFLVRKNVDDMRYTRQNGQNILTVLKRI